MLPVMLRRYWRELGLGDLAAPDACTATLLTPRFQASAHVLYFVRRRPGGRLIAVAKAPRVLGDHARLSREAGMLRRVQQHRDGPFAGIPRVLAFTDCDGYRVLVQSGLEGEGMNPAFVRRHRGLALQLGTDWLIDFHRRTRHAVPGAFSWPAEPVETTIERVATALAASGDEAAALQRTQACLQPLLSAERQAVMAHNDFSHPNLLRLGGVQLGIVDWELADADGLPAVDLYFFLTYLAFAIARARTATAYVRAFRQAFWGNESWARMAIQRYTTALELDAILCKPLFVFCWLRYVYSLIERLAPAGAAGGSLPRETACWLRQNRYYLLWRFAIDHFDELHIG